MAEIAGEAKSVGFGSQIRSYVLQPYQMVKDLRTSWETGSIVAVLVLEISAFDGVLSELPSGPRLLPNRLRMDSWVPLWRDSAVIALPRFRNPRNRAFPTPSIVSRAAP